LRFDKEHTEHSQKYGISIQIFFHEHTFRSFKTNSKTLGFEKYGHSVPAHIHLGEVGGMGQAICNYTNKYKENQKES
jgi:hypothetical protein